MPKIVIPRGTFIDALLYYNLLIFLSRVSSRSKSLGTVSRQELDVMIAEIKGSEAEENSPGMFLLASQVREKPLGMLSFFCYNV